jgi:hypothetical protein
MAASYEQTPGTLNLSFNRSDDFSTLIDFSISMSSHTVTAVIYSLISGDTVQAFTVTASNASAGQFNISLTDAQTAATPRGTYGWRMTWTESNATRTALTGFVEVL